MHHNLRELAKLATGLVLADALSALWLSSAHLLPIDFFGASITQTLVVPAVVFDSVLALLLAHYGWGIKLPVRTMRERTMLMVVGVLFAAVALVHWVRIAFGMDLVLGSWLVPVWLSWIGVVATTYLSYLSFHFALKQRNT
ncbi:MAG: hypothetical protein B7X04_03130 [Parcubacteria group bacterium 21-54-25]|nr:MAG: hypothetical protein B7X04_03130 [Parcubacteria group bacterium 21-54-25]HQU07982.1 hypothetical protein [Candidatus Paceibacterota bacterium]